jgi:hypothetical protein
VDHLFSAHLVSAVAFLESAVMARPFQRLLKAAALLGVGALIGLGGCHHDSTPDQKTPPPSGEKSDESASGQSGQSGTPGQTGQQPAAGGAQVPANGKAAPD